MGWAGAMAWAIFGDGDRRYPVPVTPNRAREHMTAPLCPHCRERMSSVEQGLGGVWSCVYCEGTWLTAKQRQSLASATGGGPADGQRASPALQVIASEESLICPACEASQLGAVSLGAIQAHRCPDCEGAFFRKGVVSAHAPQLMSRAQEAPIASTLLGAVGTVVMLGDALPMIAAMAWRSRVDRER